MNSRFERGKASVLFSFDLLTRTRELESRVNSHETLALRSFKQKAGFSTLINSYATLVLVWPEHEITHTKPCLSILINCHATLVLVNQDMRFKKTLIKTLAYQPSFINSHAILVLVWPKHGSWEDSRANSRLSAVINSHGNHSCSRFTRTWENSHTNSHLSTLINSHATLVLVWPGHESSENSHTNSSWPILLNSHATCGFGLNKFDINSARTHSNMYSWFYWTISKRTDSAILTPIVTCNFSLHAKYKLYEIWRTQLK